MLKKLEAIENLLNAMIIRIFDLLVSIFKALLPKSFKKLLGKIQLKLKNLVVNSKNNIFKLKKNGVSKLKKTKLSFFLAIDRFINYSHQKEFNKLITRTNLYITQTPLRVHLKNILLFIKNIFKNVFRNSKSIIDSQSFVRVFSVFLIVLGSSGIYFSTQDIYQSENPTRAPASVQQYDYRPNYKTFESRTFKVMNVKIPIEVESVREIDSITVEFTIRTTTRFARVFLENYEYKLKDYFFTTVEPVVSDFPIKEEGKAVLKEKITEEVNNFLRENAVEGQVEEIEIVFIVAS